MIPCDCGCGTQIERGNTGSWVVEPIGTFWFKDPTHKQTYLDKRFGVDLSKAEQPVVNNIPLGHYY